MQPGARLGAPPARHRSRLHAPRLLSGGLEEHLGPLKERKLECRKVGCARKRLDGSNYCVEHLIADRFGRHLAKLDASRPPRD